MPTSLTCHRTIVESASAAHGSWARRAVPAVLAIALTTGLSACSKDETPKPRVPSLTTSPPSPSPSASKDTEKELVKYVECLRKQGLDIPDPTVGPDGELGLGGPRSNPSATTTIDPAKVEAALKACGAPPKAALGGVDPTKPEFQDAAVKFTKCLRTEGIDVPDPDFSKGSVNAMSDLAKKITNQDPKTVAALEKCRPLLNAVIPSPGNS